MKMKDRIVTLDVREELKRGREPFPQIMQTVGRLQSGQSLRLIAPFEPKPLYGVLGNRGFSHVSTPLESGDWEVVFTPQGEAVPAAPLPAKPASGAETCVVDVDARGLEPPQPLIKILESIEQLPPHAALRARTDKRPMHLYAHLEERGFSGETSEHPEGGFVTLIRHI